MKKLKTDVAVIGGGAAGYMAAVSAAEMGAGVIIIERGETQLKKLRITGKGRCNVTNACEPQDVIKNVPKNGKFLYSSLRAFTPGDAAEFFENLGVPLKTERGNRVFPVSDKAGDIAEALIRRARELGVETLHRRALDVKCSDGAVCAVDCGDVSVTCHAAIIATGGLSYPKTGSTGDGYEIARRLGHEITQLSPSLVPLESEDGDCAAMQGLSLKNVRLTVTDKNGGTVYREQGEMQFTHFGVTGPMVLSASAHMGDGKYTAEIDLKPALDEQKLDTRILRDFGEGVNRDFKNALDALLPRLMIPVVIRRSGIAPEAKVNSVTREQRGRLVDVIKHFRVDISGKRPIDEAVITSGGVNVAELRPASMESKLVKGLLFAGEIIDVDAYTGGFNLQIAWSTGHAAGQAAAEMCAAAKGEAL